MYNLNLLITSCDGWRPDLASLLGKDNEEIFSISRGMFTVTGTLRPRVQVSADFVMKIFQNR